MDLSEFKPKEVLTNFIQMLQFIVMLSKFIERIIPVLEGLANE